MWRNSIIHPLPQGITGKGAKIKKVVVMMGGCVIVSVIGSQIPFIGGNLPIKKSDLLLKKNQSQSFTWLWFDWKKCDWLTSLRQTTIILPSLSPKKKDAHPFRHKQRISWFPLSLPTNIYYIFMLALLSLHHHGWRERRWCLWHEYLFGQRKELNSIHNVR